VSIKVVGALLITALLIIPAAAARNLSHTPEAMAVIAVLCGIIAALGGVGLSFTLNTQAGPSIVCTAAALFVLSLLRRRA
jgi:zinc transport system permease protein